MDLQNHAGTEVLGLETAVDACHSNLYYVGGGALDGGVDGVALGISANHGVVAVDVAQIATAVECGLGVTLLAGAVYALLHILMNARISLEITVYEGFCFGATHVETFSQAEG